MKIMFKGGKAVITIIVDTQSNTIVTLYGT